MALIECAGCQKRISNISPRCPLCGHVHDEVDDERAQELARRALRDRVYHLNMTSYAVISLFLAAFGWYWWASDGFQSAPGRGPIVLVGFASIAYMGIRVLLFQARKKLKRLKRLL